MRASKDSSKSPEFSFLSTVRTLWKQKFYLAFAWILVTTAGIAAAVYLPSIYKAETLILVDSQKIPEKLVSSTVNAELQDRLATISQQILSATRLLKIVEKFNLYQQERRRSVQEEIVEMMRKDINIKLERGWMRNQPGAFRITYQGKDPETVAAVVNQIGSLFIEENLRSREGQAVGTSEFIENQLQQAKKSLEDQEAKLSQYKQAHAGELPQQESSLSSTLARLQIELQGNQDALNRAHQNKIMLESALSIAEPSLAVMVENLQRQNEAVVRGSATAINTPAAAASPARKQSEVMQEELNTLRLRYNENHPEVRALVVAIERLKAIEQKQSVASSSALARASASPEMAEKVLRERERLANLRAQIAVTQKEIESRQVDHQQILANIAMYQSRLEKLPLREQEMAAVKRDYEISKANYESLLNKNLAADMAADMEKRQKAERFTVLDTARVPEKPFKPNRILFGALGWLFGLFAGIALAFVREMKTNVVLGEWELPPDLIILGRIPRIESSL